MIWIILLLAFILRLVCLNQSLWLDEAINIVAARNLDLISFITKYPIGDFHPPGYFIILWFWGRLFGFSEISVRMPSVFMGVITVWLTFLIAKKFFSQKTALLAALFMAFAPLHIYYSQEARMYSFAALCVAASCYFLSQLLDHKKYASLGYIFSMALLFYSDYVAYFIIPAQIVFVFWVRRKDAFRFLLILSASCVALLPWLFVLPQQLLTGQKTSQDLPGWGKVVGSANIKNLILLNTKTWLGRISLENKILYGGIIAILDIVYGLIIFRGLRKMDEGIKFILCWLIIPIILVFITSFFLPVFSYFRLIFILPAFYVLLAKGIMMLPSKVVNIAAGLIILVSVISLGFFWITPQNQRENWRGAINFIENSERNALVLFENNTILSPAIYYSRNSTGMLPGLKKIPAQKIGDITDIEKTNYDQVYVFEYLVEITDAQRLLEKRLINLGFKKENTYDFDGVGFIHLYHK